MLHPEVAPQKCTITIAQNPISKKADSLTHARKIAITGEAIGEAQFDGSQDVQIYTTVERLTNTELEEMLT